MNKAYQRINDGKGWEDYPSDKTPLSKHNLDKGDIALDEIDNRVIMLDETKASKVEISTLFKEVSYEETTGIITFTRKNGATVTIDTPMEKIQTGIYYNPDTEKLVLPLIDGTSMEVDLSRLMKFDEFVDSDTIAFSVKSNGTVTAIVKEGSIEEKHLQPNYLADIKLETAKAKTSAESAADSAEEAENYFLFSLSYAVGNSGVRPGDNTDNAKYYSEQAKASAEQANEVVSQGTVTSVNGQTGDVDITPENIGALPVDGTASNSDKLDGLHASDFFQCETDQFNEGETILGWANTKNWNASRGVVSPIYPSDAPFNAEGFVECLIVNIGGSDGATRKTILYRTYITDILYARTIFGNQWYNDWRKIDVDTSDFFQKQPGSNDLVLPIVGTGVRGEEDNTYNHFIQIGHNGQNVCRMYEWGGLFEFYQYRHGPVPFEKLLGKISENGWEGKVNGNDVPLIQSGTFTIEVSDSDKGIPTSNGYVGFPKEYSETPHITLCAQADLPSKTIVCTIGNKDTKYFLPYITTNYAGTYDVDWIAVGK